jgi:biopolymer transport protein ExbD
MPKVMPQPSANESRGRRGRRTSSTLAEINIIPLVDVMLVLLIIFMVAAPMLQRGVEVNLPQTRNTQKMTEERIYITVPLSYRQDRRVYIDDEAVSIDFLAERTRQAMLGKDQQEVFLRSDGEVQMQEVLQVFASLKDGGIERVGIVALERAQGRGGR